jgi:hypothetical protein
MYQEFEKKAIISFKKLKENKKINIKEISSSFRDLSEDIIKNRITRTENNYKIKIPEEFYPYILSIDEVKLKWNINSDFDFPGGEFYIRNVTGMFYNPLETFEKDDISPDDAKLLKQGYRFFAFHYDDRSAIKISEKEIESNVFFVPSAEEPMKLEISYPEYMDYSLKTKGFWGWQYLFTGLKFKDFDFNLEADLKESFECLEVAFPNEDFSEYYERFESMK